MARVLKNSKLNPVSNPDYVDDSVGAGDESGAAERRTNAIATATGATTNAGDFDLREAAKKALAAAQKG